MDLGGQMERTQVPSHLEKHQKCQDNPWGTLVPGADANRLPAPRVSGDHRFLSASISAPPESQTTPVDGLPRAAHDRQGSMTLPTHQRVTAGEGDRERLALLRAGPSHHHSWERQASLPQVYMRQRVFVGKSVCDGDRSQGPRERGQDRAVWGQS